MANKSPAHSPPHSPPPTGGAESDSNPNVLMQFSEILQTVLTNSRLEMEKLIDERLGNKRKGPEGETSGHKETPEAMAASKLSYKAFKSCRAKEFDGKVDPMLAFDWIDNIEKAFELSFCEDEYKVQFATAMFTGQAQQWWKLQSDSMGDERRKTMTWPVFKVKFISQFCPGDLQRRYEREFLDLTQGNLTVTQYAVEFQRKARFASVYIPTEEMKVRRFVAGLKWEIRELVLIQNATTLEKAMEFAREREEALTMRSVELLPLSSVRPNPSSFLTFSVGGSSVPARSVSRPSGSQSV